METGVHPGELDKTPLADVLALHEQEEGSRIGKSSSNDVGI